MSDIEILNAGQENGLGEGPLWLADDRQLLWVDVASGLLWRYDENTARTAYRTLPKRPTSLARAVGGIVLVFRRQIGFLRDFDADVEIVELSDTLDERERLNDCTVDPQGRLWIGSMDIAQSESLGRLYCLGLDLSIEPAAERLIVANGLAWSDDGNTLFAVDSGRREIQAFEISDGKPCMLGPRTVFAYPPSEMPDGMTMDAEGKLWVAVVGAGRVDRICPSGKRLDSVVLPVASPTSCAIGGTTEYWLYCTSMRLGMSDTEIEAAPMAGATFRIPIAAPPRQDWRFAGW